MQNSELFRAWMPWMLIGVLIILILAATAAYYLWQLRKARRAQAEALAKLQQEQQQEKDEKRQKAMNSIRILAASLGTDQITWTEGAMRISVLLPHVTQDVEAHRACGALLELAEKTQHIPILADWKALSKKEQKVFDKERLGYEKALLPQLQAAIAFLNSWPLIQAHTTAVDFTAASAQNQSAQNKKLADLAVRVGN